MTEHARELKRVCIISIRTPLAGSDSKLILDNFQLSRFQSALPSRGVTYFQCTYCTMFRFQSTLPSRGVTFLYYFLPFVYKFQSTLPSRGVTNRAQCSGSHPGISIHTPLAGSDCNPYQLHNCYSCISIHTPLAGSDHGWFRLIKNFYYFNPHSPRGE